MMKCKACDTEGLYELPDAVGIGQIDTRMRDWHTGHKFTHYCVYCSAHYIDTLDLWYGGDFMPLTHLNKG